MDDNYFIRTLFLVILTTPDIELTKQMNQRTRTNKNCEDDKSTISSSSKDTSKGIGTEPNKNPEETIKNARRSLRIKQIP